MNVLLLPRLNRIGVARVLDSLGSSAFTSTQARSLINEGPSMLSFAASGGNRSEDLAEAIGESLCAIAESLGYAENTNQQARSLFDQEAAIYLASNLDLRTGEALRDDVWAYLATIVVPQIVCWRFPDLAPHRFEGGVRNALQRLWFRGTVLDRGEQHPDRWRLIRALTEDAAVQIFERPSISGNGPLARSLAERWLRMAAKIGRSNMEPVMRRATKLVRLRNEIVDVGGLPDSERDAFVTSCFVAAWNPNEA